MNKNIFDEVLILDGAMGTMLWNKVPDLPQPAELVNLTNPQAVTDIHNEYADAGSDVVYTNTFGANRFKLGDKVGEVIRAAVACARKSRAKYVALDIGPLGRIVGDNITFEEAYDVFAEQVKAAANTGVDTVVIETMLDLGEVKAAVLAVRENSDLPVMVSMSFNENGKTPFGVSPACFAIVAEGLGVSAIGANCSVGPDKLYPVAKELLAHTTLPVFIKANAGLPVTKNGVTYYDLKPREYVSQLLKIHELGVNVFGGCCGTDPSYIAEIHGTIKDFCKKDIKAIPALLCSARRTVNPDHTVTVGERINPTGKKRFQAALRAHELDYILSEGMNQTEAGAEILDVNLGLNGVDELSLMREITDRLNTLTDAVIMADSSSPEVLECAVRRTPGKGVINSVNGSAKSLDEILPIAKKYGWAVIGLTLDENGIPASPDDRVAIAKRIIERATAIGIPLSDIFIDCLTMAEAGERGNANVTLETLKKVAALGCNTALGLSNVSFGMPRREELNRAFYALASDAGLTLAIINPAMLKGDVSQFAYDFLANKPQSAENYIAYAQNTQTVTQKVENKATLYSAILSGQRELAVKLVGESLENTDPMDIVNGEIIPALDKVGELFESGKYFLPQLISAADASSAVFEVIKAKLPTDNANKGLLILATVKGDVHEIGKNIVKAVVENYGYKVIDLGKDVDYDVILDAVKKHYPCVLGLSALMTTTAENMAETVRLVHASYPDMMILTGGAVVTQEFADSINGVYCKDAADTVKKLKDYYD